MQLELKLFANLQKFMPEQERIEWEEDCTVSDLLIKIGVSPSEVAIVLVNGRHAQFEQKLHDGETVAIFPPIAGG
jgi:molybdopterin converting factor small subunit